MDNSNINPKLKELTRRLSGRWRVKGRGITGEAEYVPVKDGAIRVMHVDFYVDGKSQKNIQHIAYDQDTDTLRSHYMDTMGDEASYVWILEGRTIRVSHGRKDSSMYFEATLNDDDSEYAGIWYYPDNGGQDTEAARIIYTRIK